MKKYKVIFIILSVLGCAKEFPVDVVPGCTDKTAFNYDPLANTDDGSCFPVIYGCMDETAANFIEIIGSGNVYEDVNTDDGSCLYDEDGGCMDETAFNYDETAIWDDGSCEPIVLGCIDELYLEYNPQANTDDGSCLTLLLVGCTDASACNYNPNANDDDGSCEYPEQYYDCNGSCVNDSDGDNICDELEIEGCTDENAQNYNPNATDDDGTCQYPPNCSSNSYLSYGEGPWILDLQEPVAYHQVDW